MRIAVVAVFAIVASAGLSGCVQQFLTGETDVAAPEFQLRDIDGVNHTLADYQDRILLLDMFGTWCGPCQRSVPVKHELLRTYPQVDILSISGTDTAAQVAAFRDKYNTSWPLAVDTDNVVARYSEAASPRNGILWPSYALIHDGRVVFFNAGETLPSTWVNAIAALTGDAGEPWDGGAVASLAGAFVLGVLAWFAPTTLRETVLRDPAQRRQMLPAVIASTLGLFALLAWFTGPANRFLSGRVFLLAPFVVAATVLAFLWWRRGRNAEPGKRDLRRQARSPMRQAFELPLSVLWAASPAWYAVMLAGMMSLQLGLGVWLQAAFGLGLVAAVIASWRPGPIANRLAVAGPALAWVGLIGWLLGSAWTLWLRFG